MAVHCHIVFLFFLVLKRLSNIFPFSHFSGTFEQEHEDRNDSVLDNSINWTSQVKFMPASDMFY